MGDCVHCGQAAGLFRSEHPECAERIRRRERREFEEAADSARTKRWERDRKSSLALELCRSGLQRSITYEEMRKHLNALAVPDVRFMQVRLVEEAIASALSSGLLTEEDDKAIATFVHECGLRQEEVDVRGAWSRLAKAAVLRDVLNGVMTSRVKLSGSPFNLQKNEVVFWVFNRVRYLEEKVYRERVGESRGFTVQLGRGVYRRWGSFESRIIESSSIVHVDTGAMAMTNKHIYFGGDRKSFRVPFRKIVTFDAYSDGIGIMRDAQTAKPQKFVTSDGWFAYNLAVNLARIE